MTHPITDFKVIHDGGSVSLLIAKNDRAREFIKDRVSEEAVWFGSGLAVETKYLDGVLSDLIDNQFIIELA